MTSSWYLSHVLQYIIENRNSTKICRALIQNVLIRSQRNFAHVITVTLSWCMQNFVVIGDVYFELEQSKFWSNFEFDRNIVSGTGAWSIGAHRGHPLFPPSQESYGVSIASILEKKSPVLQQDHRPIPFIIFQWWFNENHFFFIQILIRCAAA